MMQLLPALASSPMPAELPPVKLPLASLAPLPEGVAAALQPEERAPRSALVHSPSLAVLRVSAARMPPPAVPNPQWKALAASQLASPLARARGCTVALRFSNLGSAVGNRGVKGPAVGNRGVKGTSAHRLGVFAAPRVGVLIEG